MCGSCSSQCSADVCEHAIWMSQDFLAGDLQYAIAELVEECDASAPPWLAFFAKPAIELDDQGLFMAGVVHDERTDFAISEKPMRTEAFC
jgi:hypothetical protein